MASRKTKTVIAEDGVASDAKEQREQVKRRVINDAGKWLQRPCKNDAEVEDRIGQFKSIIASTDPPELPLVESLAQFLGMSFHKFRKCLKGDDCSPRRQNALQEAVTWISGIWAQLASLNEIYFGLFVWYSKNWFDMREPDSRLVLDAVSPLKELAPAKEVAAKYLTDLGIDPGKKTERATEV